MPRPPQHDTTTTNAQTRATLLSKALSRLLRHAAMQEKVPIDEAGYVRLDHLLSWRGLGKFVPKVEAGEVLEGVRGSEKARFGLKYDGKTTLSENGVVGADVNSQSETETQRALRIWDEGMDRDVTQFFIRANQGHSIKNVAAEGLLKKITLDDEGTEAWPRTVVHGTFYGAWESILSEGTLRKMGRNHVHFSMGPALEVVKLAEEAQHGDGDSHGEECKGGTTKQSSKGGGILAKMMEDAKVVSGMRKDAEVLIYIDLKTALGKGMKWYRSENGVILTEGLESEGGGGVGVGKEFWLEVVEVKEGMGTLWKTGAVAKELPERLRGRAAPRGKERRGRGGRGGGRDERGTGGGRGRGRGGRDVNGDGQHGSQRSTAHDRDGEGC